MKDKKLKEETFQGKIMSRSLACEFQLVALLLLVPQTHYGGQALGRYEFNTLLINKDKRKHKDF